MTEGMTEVVGDKEIIHQPLLDNIDVDEDNFDIATG